MNNIPRIGDKIINGKLVRAKEIVLPDVSSKQVSGGDFEITEPDNISSFEDIENTQNIDASVDLSNSNDSVSEQISDDTQDNIVDDNNDDAEQNDSAESVAPAVDSADKEYSISQFKNDYENRLRVTVLPMLDSYEGERKNRLIGACAASGILGLLAAIDLLFVDADKHGDIFWALVGAAAGSWFLIKKSFEKKIKRKVMPILMRAIPDFSWQEKPPVTVDDMQDAKIFPLIPKCKVTSDDCFKGKYRNVCIDITECDFMYGKKSVFQGAVIKIEMNKNFTGTTVIRPKKDIEFKYVKDLKKAKLEKIELEDLNFNKIYETYSTDQIEARYLLTTSFIDRFKNIALAFSSKVAFCAFHGKYVYIAPYCKKDLFSIGSLVRPISDDKQFMRLFSELVSILELVDYFKLDKKLGL